jgi:hypothetical protein
VSLYKVTTGWLANGKEGVLLEAPDHPTAVAKAQEFFMTDAAIEMKMAAGYNLADHHRERLRSYRDEPEQFRAVRIILPHKDEFRW